PVVAAGVALDQPAMVLHANRVIARTPAATARGVLIGHRRRDAQRACPLVRIVDHDPARDARAFEAAVRSIAAMVPRLETTEPGLLTFPAKGPARYFGGEHAMAGRVGDLLVAAIPSLATVSATGVSTGIGLGIGDGRFTAGVAARRSVRAMRAGRDISPVVVDAGQRAAAAFLAPLGVDLLRDVAGVDPAVVDLFRRLGIRTLGARAALPASEVFGRFGHAGAFAHRVAGGGDDRPPGAERPSPDWVVAQHFDNPVTLIDPLVFAAKQLAASLLARLRANGMVCTRLTVAAVTDGGERTEHAWYRPHGLSAAAIVERVRWQITGWIRSGRAGAATAGAPTSGVVSIELIPDEVCADAGVQLGFWGGRSVADDWAARAVARVVGLVGGDQVLVPAAQGGRHPEDTYRWVPVEQTDLTEPAQRLAPANTGHGATERAPWWGQLPAPSPATVLAEALPVELVDRSGVTVRVDGRGGLHGEPAVLHHPRHGALSVVTWAGPWPVDERWWDPVHQRRLARLQIVTRDGTAALVVAEHRRWWITALYT
ncbi:MAG TPA: DNA polymerase Y family protein, partial [Ilumatobacteraceae bacterium]|nr:DNA polymerase Y family protein [Ilumatobacteraceae bacterium]